MDTLRALLIQRAARMQRHPAFSVPGDPNWTLDYSQLRNRVEGLALGLLAEPLPAGSAIFLEDAGPWVWIAELAAAACGLRWERGGDSVPPACLGGPGFNHDEGRGPYHDRDKDFGPDAPFTAGLTQGELLRRLARLNQKMGWDHDSVFRVPPALAATPAGRGALWSALYAGAEARVEGASKFDPNVFSPLGLEG